MKKSVLLILFCMSINNLAAVLFDKDNEMNESLKVATTSTVPLQVNGEIWSWPYAHWVGSLAVTYEDDVVLYRSAIPFSPSVLFTVGAIREGHKIVGGQFSFSVGIETGLFTKRVLPVRYGSTMELIVSSDAKQPVALSIFHIMPQSLNNIIKHFIPASLSAEPVLEPDTKGLLMACGSRGVRECESTIDGMPTGHELYVAEPFPNTLMHALVSQSPNVRIIDEDIGSPFFVMMNQRPAVGGIVVGHVSLENDAFHTVPVIVSARALRGRWGEIVFCSQQPPVAGTRIEIVLNLHESTQKKSAIEELSDDDETPAAPATTPQVAANTAQTAVPPLKLAGRDVNDLKIEDLD